MSVRNGANVSAEEFDTHRNLGTNSSTSTTAVNQRQRITSLAPHPSRPGVWLLSIDGNTPFAVRDSKLRSAKRVLNIASYQGVVIVDMPDQAAWAAMLVKARQGGAA